MLGTLFGRDGSRKSKGGWGLFHAADKQAIVIEEWAIDATVQAIEAYKKSKNFLDKVVKTIVDAYRIRFNDYKDKVAQAHSQLNQSKISTVEGEPEGGEGEGATKKEVTKIENAAAKEPGAEVAMIEAPRNWQLLLRYRLRNFLFFL